MNHVEVSDERWAILDNSKSYLYTTSYESAVWESSLFTVKGDKIFRENTEVETVEDVRIMCSIFFFIADEQTLDSRAVYTVLMLISDFGGFHDIAISLLVMYFTAYN